MVSTSKISLLSGGVFHIVTWYYISCHYPLFTEAD